MEGDVQLQKTPMEPLSQIEDEAVFHVTRMLNGAVYSEPEGEDGETVGLMHGGRCITMTRHAYKLYRRLADRLKVDLAAQGLRMQLDPTILEQIFYTQHQIGKQSFAEFRADPRRLRVLWMRATDSGCTFYRTVQPVAYLQKLVDNSPLKIEENAGLSLEFGLQYDMIVAPRVTDRGAITTLKELKDRGRIIVYETDDLLDEIPEWNPHAGDTRLSKFQRKTLRSFADGIIASTPELKRGLGRPEVTWSCMNGIHPPSWPMTVADHPATDEIRIMWAGGASHAKDLELIVPAITRLSHRFRKKRLKWVFVGYLPRAVRKPIMKDEMPRWMMKDEYHDIVESVNGCSVYEWAGLLKDQRCHMAIAPLVPHTFNECKSELKCLEAWALGLPVIASEIAPYQRAIQDESQGILVPPDPKAWEKAIERVAQSHDLRQELAAGGLKRLNDAYTMERIVGSYERALLEIALGCGDRLRPECLAVVKERMMEIGE